MNKQGKYVYAYGCLSVDAKYINIFVSDRCMTVNVKYINIFVSVSSVHFQLMHKSLYPFFFVKYIKMIILPHVYLHHQIQLKNARFGLNSNKNIIDLCMNSTQICIFSSNLNLHFEVRIKFNSNPKRHIQTQMCIFISNSTKK